MTGSDIGWATDPDLRYLHTPEIKSLNAANWGLKFHNEYQCHQLFSKPARRTHHFYVKR
jgi:hypothetical protein